MRESPEAIAATAKAAPPLAVTGITIAGYPLADWVLVATLLYTVLQILVVARRLLWQRRAADTDPACADTCPALKKHREGGHIRTRVAAGLLALSASGLVGVAVHEAYVGTAMQPLPGDKWTIGLGSTTRADGSAVQPGDRITVPAALELAARDIAVKEAGLKRCLADVLLYQHEYDALVSLAYNVGTEAVCRSSIPGKLQRGDYAAACKTILDFDGFRDRTKPKIQDPRTGKWDYPMVKVRGLTMRRQREYAQCLGAPDQ